MSDERPVFARFRCPFAGIAGNKILTIEYFEARHWTLRHGMQIYPAPGDIDEVDWCKMYRLRLNGRWFGPKRYSFYSFVDAALLVEKILEKNGELLLPGNLLREG